MGGEGLGQCVLDACGVGVGKSDIDVSRRGLATRHAWDTAGYPSWRMWKSRHSPVAGDQDTVRSRTKVWISLAAIASR